MSLLNLPTEITERIISYTNADDFENIALACKATYAISSAFLATHNARRKQFSKFRYEEGRKIQSNLQLLLAFMEDPSLSDSSEDHSFLTREYVRSADLYYNHEEHDEEFFDSAPRIGDGTADAMLALSLSSKPSLDLGTPLVMHPELRARFKDHLDDLLGNISEEGLVEWDSGWYRGDILEQLGKEGGCLILLMLLCYMPNVKELRPSDDWALLSSSEDEDWWPVVDEYVRVCNEHSLGKLERILPFDADSGEQHYNELTALVPFMALHSVREVIATNCIADGSFTWKYADAISNLRTLILHDCAVNAEAMEELVRHTPLLEVLRYSHSDKEYDYSPNMGKIVSGVGRHLGKTLKELALYIPDDEFIETRVPIKTMKEFIALKTLWVEISMFRGGDDHEDEEPDDEEDESIDGEDDGDCVRKIPCLANILPSNISADIYLLANMAKDNETAHSIFDMSPAQRERLSNCHIVVQEKGDTVEGTEAEKLIIAAGGQLVAAPEVQWNDEVTKLCRY